MPAVSFTCPAKTCAGSHALENLPFELGAMGASKPMVILDSRASGMVRHLKQAFRASGMTVGISSPLPENASPEDPALFVRDLYDRFREKGFDALIALGGPPAADAAKAVNIAVSLGPDALKQGRITRPLSPLVYLPTGTDAMEGAGASARFNQKTFYSPFLCPDLVMIDPKLMQPEDRPLLLDRALTCLALSCEVFSFSPSAPERAYGAAAAALARSVLEELLASGLKGPDSLKEAARENGRAQKKLVQAAVMAGYISSGPQPLFSLALGRAIAAKGSVSRGQIMAVVLPAVLESESSPTLGQLLLHLSNPEHFSAVPKTQHPLAAVQEIRTLTHRLFSLSHGLLPRTLEEAGWSPEALERLGVEISKNWDFTETQAARLTRILSCARDGRPAEKGEPHGDA